MNQNPHDVPTRYSLDELLELFEVTQSELAKAIGTRAENVSRWVLGERGMCRDDFHDVLSFFGVTAKDVDFFWTHDKKRQVEGKPRGPLTEEQRKNLSESLLQQADECKERRIRGIRIEQKHRANRNT